MYARVPVQVILTATYNTFVVQSEADGYRLTIGDYDSTSSTASDMMSLANNQQFTTYDRDNDEEEGENCAVSFKGGFWYRKCADRYRITATGEDCYWGDEQLQNSVMYVMCTP